MAFLKIYRCFEGEKNKELKKAEMGCGEIEKKLT